MIVQEIENDYTMITLDGRLDLEGTQKIDQQFAYATSVRPLKLAVNLSGVPFIASIGVRTLLNAARAQAGRGGRMVLLGPAPIVRNILETAGVDRIVPILNDWETARAVLRPAT